MKVFFLGDFESNTGPAIANKALRKGLIAYKNVVYSDARYKLTRVFELISKIISSDVVCLCSPSQANLIAIKIANLFSKPVFYIMHGYMTLEESMNSLDSNPKVVEKAKHFEREIFKNVKKVFCVSEKFMHYMQCNEPEFSDKFDFNFNGVDLKRISHNRGFRSHNQIISVGGGMRRKNNLAICKAIEKLNKEENLGLNYVVIGLPYSDKNDICSYDFVTYYDYLPHEEIIQLLSESYLYIQNSLFETYGITVIEAIINGCNLLISNSIGCIDVIGGLEEKDIIFEPSDIEEISSKIKVILKNGNADKIRGSLSYENIYCDNTAIKLINKIAAYVGDNNEINNEGTFN